MHRDITEFKAYKAQKRGASENEYLLAKIDNAESEILKLAKNIGIAERIINTGQCGAIERRALTNQLYADRKKLNELTVEMNKKTDEFLYRTKSGASYTRIVENDEEEN